MTFYHEVFSVRTFDPNCKLLDYFLMVLILI